MKWVKTPVWIQWLFPKLVWKIPETQKIIYFTFDDGPTPGITPLVLDFLFQHHAKATFFCTGSQAEKFPGLVDAIRKGGHVVANHGYHHVSGFRTNKKAYLHNAIKGAEITKSHLFRPPYGRITPGQIKTLFPRFVIVEWSLMSMDFSSEFSVEDCFNRVAGHGFPGAIVVFHDTLQASDRLTLLLPRLLSHFEGLGYSFKALDQL